MSKINFKQDDTICYTSRDKQSTIVGRVIGVNNNKQQLFVSVDCFHDASVDFSAVRSVNGLPAGAFQ